MSVGAAAQTMTTKTPLVLIVDDLEANRALLVDQLTLLGYRTDCAVNGMDAFDAIGRERPDLILLDLSMPIMDGQTFLQKANEDDEIRRIPVIVISGLDDMATVVRCIERGAEDYLVKPFKPRILQARVKNVIAKVTLQEQELALRRITERYNQELEVQVKEQVRLISQAQLSTIFALSTLAESRDPETGAHLDRMRLYCRILAEGMAKNRLFSREIDEAFPERIFSASPLHDIGKVGIPDHVLLKAGKLTEDEFEIMKRHCEIGARTLARVHDDFPENKFIQMGIEIAISHHERWDGSGYPNGVSGDKIPLSARILALCDVYDALTSKRCYKEAFSHEESKQLIVEGRGLQFQPEIVDAFLGVEDRFTAVRGEFHQD
jgi:putative two-component system response regulator